MSAQSPAITRQELLAENAELRARLAVAEETLRAIRAGEVEALNRLPDELLAPVNTVVLPTDDGHGAAGSASSPQGPLTAFLQLETLLRTAPLGVGFFDCELCFVRINERLARMNGFTVEEHIGRHLSELVPSLLEPIKEVTDRILATGKPVCDHELSGETPAAPGVIRHWNESWYPVLDATGKIIGFGVVVEEITERKLAEATLRESEERLRIFIENAPAAIAQFDREMRYMAASHRWMQDYGLTGKDIIGRSHYEFFPDLPDAWKEVHCRTLAGEVMRAEADRFERADGSVQWVKWETLPWRTSANEIGGMLIAAEEITARRNAEREREKLVQMIERSEDFIATADLDGHLTYLNAGARQMIGIACDEDIRGLRLGDLVPGKWQDFSREVVLPTTRSQGSWKGEMQFRNLRSDAVIDVHRNVFLIRDPQTGEPWCFASVTRDISERKLAMEELRESNERLTLAMDAAKLGSFEWNIRSGVNRWTPELEAIYGLPPGGFVGTQSGWENLVHPDDAAEARRLVEFALSSGDPVEGEWRVVWPDGSVHWVMGRFQVVKDADGDPLRMVGVNLDITGRKQAEEELRQSRTDLDRAQQVGQIGSWRLDIGRNILTWSDENYRIFGIPKETPLTYEAFLAAIHPEDREYVDARWHAALGGMPYDIEHRIVVDGQVKWVRERAFLELDDEGGLLGGFGITHDITERKLTEQVLRDSDQRMRLATEATGVGIWEWHVPAGRIKWDAEMFRIYGIAPTEDGFVDYGVWRDSVLPEDLALQEEILQDTCRRLGSGSREFRIQRHDDGEIRHIRAVEAVRTNADGQIEWLVGTNLDITERRLADEKIQQLNTRLEQRVRERTSQLEAANRELEAFSYSVSHDLRAPLRAVIGFVRLIQNAYAETLDAEGHRLLGVVAGEALRMGRLIDDLLAFSRMGRQQVAHTSVDMAAIVCAEFENLTVASTEAAPCLILKPLPPAQGDPVMLRQVFANLLGNAVKFTRGKASATIEVGGESHEGWTTYYVKDNGVGFDEKYGHKLFGVFQRLHSANDFEGNGVGLALVQRIVHRHGGQVRAEGTPNAGATFYFTLPTSPLPSL